MKKNKNKCIYISSKMSGLPNYNFEGFRRKELELKYSSGGKLDVYNPAMHEPDKTSSMWSEYLAMDLVDIETKCDGIYMFGKWYKSQGACIELLAAHRLGLEIIIENKWLQWIPSVLNILFKTTGGKQKLMPKAGLGD